MVNKVFNWALLMGNKWALITSADYKWKRKEKWQMLFWASAEMKFRVRDRWFRQLLLGIPSQKEMMFWGILFIYAFFSQSNHFWFWGKKANYKNGQIWGFVAVFNYTFWSIHNIILTCSCPNLSTSRRSNDKSIKKNVKIHFDNCSHINSS